MRAIDADVLKEKLIEMQQVYNEPYEHYDNGFQDAVSQIDDVLDSLPTINPVKHGKWLSCSDRPDRLICSVCNRGFDMWFYEPEILPHCPNCGARMNGDKE